MELIVVLGAFVAALAPLLCWSLQHKKFKDVINRIPGPLSIPIIGTSYNMLNVKRRDIFTVMDNTTRQYRPIFRLWRGSTAEIHICKAEHVEVVLNSTVNLEKSSFYRFLQPWLGTGLVTSDGHKWHKHRKLITPAFHFKILENFLNIIVENSDVLMKKLEKEIGNAKGFDVYPYFTRCALDIICETAMGTKINAQGNAESPYVSAVYGISELTMQRILKPWLYNDFLYSLTSAGKKYTKDLHTLHGFARKVIRERKQNYVQKPKQEDGKEEEEVLGKKKRMAFLDLLLEASQDEATLTEEEMREEVDTFMEAGHDTTSANLSWTALLLGNHLDVQERVYEEMEEIFQGSNRPPTMKDLAEMKYLERVLKESLRLYPSVPIIGRKVTHEVTVGGYKIPAGAEFNLHIYHIHRDAEYFPNPEVFNPDNFLPERVQGRHPYAYIPFSAGSRNCIGQKFALMEEKAILSSLVRSYKMRALDKPEDVKPLAELSLRPDNGVKLMLERRKVN